MERHEFLFGPEHDPDALDDPDARAVILDREFGDPDERASRLFSALTSVIAEQIVADDPPEVWAAAQRLLEAGRDRRAAMHQLLIALLDPVRETLEGAGAGGPGTPFDTERYLRRLRSLPLPAGPEIIEQLRVITREEQPISHRRLVTCTERAFELEGDEVFDDMVERALELVMDRGLLEYVGRDQIVDVDSITAGILLTHRVTSLEHETGVLDASFDLPTLDWPETLTLAGDPLTRFSLTAEHLGITGPPGWLDPYPPDTVVAVSVDADGAVTMAECEPMSRSDVTQMVGGVLEQAYAEPELPIRSDQLLVELLAVEPGLFASPQPPLAELVRANGWEVRAGATGPDEQAWENERTIRRLRRLTDALDGIADPAIVAAGLTVGADDAAVGALVEELADPEVAQLVAIELTGEPELLGPDREADEMRLPPPPWATARAERMIALARGPQELANARYVAALLAERAHEPFVAEAHLAFAVEADPDHEYAIDRLAWCAADRGDAAAAVRLWQRLGADGPHQTDLVQARDFNRPQGHTPGRNEPCWCGSGRKFKQCHLGSPPLRPLAERAGWLMRKAVAYLERRGRLADDVVTELAMIVAGEDEDRLDDVFSTPIPIDIALTEEGWFEEFLTDRAQLLPEDEAALARRWAGIERTVYEVEEVEPGSTVTVRDLRTGERNVVIERTLSQKATPRQLLCARAVPTGSGHVFCGAVIPVPPGREQYLLEVIDDGDGYALADWCAGLFRPPELRNRENEPLINGEVVLDVGDDASAALDAAYERENEGEPVWIELFSITAREQILRARMALDRTRLTVTANSDVRLDRVLAELRRRFPEATELSQRREKIDADNLDRYPAAPERVTDLSAAERQELVAEYIEQFEEDWCDEPVPALGGMTPRAAAADPTHREDLERLLAKFDTAPGLMRGDRIRTLLGLS